MKLRIAVTLLLTGLLKRDISELCHASASLVLQSRGSRNPMTGPASDSSLHKSGGGGYAFIDSSFPRRPGDIALLSSPVFSPTGKTRETENAAEENNW